MRFRPVFLLLCVLAPALRATSVVPPNFPELVAEADAIYRGQVTEIQARRVARGASSVIKTFVTVSIERALKGAAQESITLEFLGGTIGEESMEVSGVPRFAVGERGIVFVQKNGQQFCPLVRLAHGTYRIEQDAVAGREFVARANRAPLHDVTEVELPLADATAPAVRAAQADTTRALSPAAFEARIVAEVRTPTLTARPH